MSRDKNLKILLLCGVPASGKTTWSNNFLLKNPNWVRVSRDGFRLMLRNESFCQNKIEALITDLETNAINSALSKRLNVIIDNTNLKEKYISPIIKKFNHRADIEFMLFDISLKKALERDVNRKASVGETVLKRMYKDFEILKGSFHFQNQPQLKREVVAKRFMDSLKPYNNDLPNAVIFDIDGTLAIMNRFPFAWDKVDLDYPNEAVIEHTHMHSKEGRRVILMSGRDCASRELTEKWLKDNNVIYDELHMRGELSGGPNQDYRKDNIIKEELYNEFVKDKYNVLTVFDDRTQVVKLWRKLGLPTFQVNESPD